MNSGNVTRSLATRLAPIAGADRPQAMQRLLILTGPGVSAESGLETFCDEFGLWTRYDLAEGAPQRFATSAKVLEFYNEGRSNRRSSVPDSAHFALRRWDGNGRATC